MDGMNGWMNGWMDGLGAAGGAFQGRCASQIRWTDIRIRSGRRHAASMAHTPFLPLECVRQMDGSGTSHGQGKAPAEPGRAASSWDGVRVHVDSGRVTLCVRANMCGHFPCIRSRPVCPGAGCFPVWRGCVWTCGEEQVQQTPAVRSAACGARRERAREGGAGGGDPFDIHRRACLGGPRGPSGALGGLRRTPQDFEGRASEAFGGAVRSAWPAVGAFQVSRMRSAAGWVGER